MKNNKPYKQYSKERVYSNNKSNKVNNLNSDFSKNNKNKKKKKEKVPTNIRIDMNRINDSESLDTSFLEGRIVKDEKKQKKVKEKVLKEDNAKKVKTIAFLRKVFLSLAVVCVILLVVIYACNSFSEYYKKWGNNKKNVVDIDEKDYVDNSSLVDNNYLFLGDFNTYKFDFNSFGLDYHYVKISSNEYTTSNLLDKLKRDVYDFNPSIIFYELGVVDVNNGKSNEEIISNIEKAMKGIKENRPYAKVYIESLYPVNKDVDNYDDSIIGDSVTNDRIVELNKLIENKTGEMDVNYFDVYSVLVKGDRLNPDFTDNGVYLNNKGYERVLKEIDKIVG